MFFSAIVKKKTRPRRLLVVIIVHAELDATLTADDEIGTYIDAINVSHIKSYDIMYHK